MAVELLKWSGPVIIDGLRKLLDRTVNLQSQKQVLLPEDAIKSINEVTTSEAATVEPLETLVEVNGQMITLFKQLDMEVPDQTIIIAKQTTMAEEYNYQLRRVPGEDTSRMLLLALLLLHYRIDGRLIRATG